MISYQIINIFLFIFYKVLIVYVKNPINLFSGKAPVPIDGQKVYQYEGLCETSCQHKCSRTQESGSCTRYKNETCKVNEKGWVALKAQEDAISMIRGINLQFIK